MGDRGRESFERQAARWSLPMRLVVVLAAAALGAIGGGVVGALLGDVGASAWIGAVVVGLGAAWNLLRARPV
jgi:hypothetical protein